MSLRPSYNTYNNKTVPSTREYNGRVKLRYSNDGNFDAVLSGDYTNNFSPSVFRNVLAYPSGAYIGLGTGDPNQVTDNFGDDVGNRVRTGGVALTMNLEVSPTFTVTSITSWRQFRYEAAYTVPYPPYGFYNVFARTGNNTFNQEIRGVYNHNGLSATFGANFYHETGHYATVAAISPTAPTVSAASPPGQRDETSLDAYAIFGQIEYQLLPKLTVMAGLRYNSESRDYSIQYFSTPSLYNGHVSDNVLIPMVGANYDFTDDVMFYAKASRGYQAPGFNYIPGAGVTTDTSFKAETLWAYEAGLKAQFLDRKVTLNLAGFYYDYKDLQVRANRSVTLYKIANAASARVKGFEAELSVRPVDWLTLSAQVTRATAEYVSYCEGSAGGTPQNGDRACTSSEGFPGYERAGNLLTQSPKWNGGVNAAVHAPIGNDTFLDASVSYGFQSRLFFTPSNIIAASSQPWQRLDARVAIAMPNGMTVYAYGKNLTNKRYINWSSIVAPASILGSVNDPMTYGIGLRFEM
jgi:Outer membrane receptor proteins, mostly Fe transport